jgi:hypothetical protein
MTEEMIENGGDYLSRFERIKRTNGTGTHKTILPTSDKWFYTTTRRGRIND